MDIPGGRTGAKAASTPGKKDCKSASGFRYNNLWLATLTGNTFPATFYVGDALGSFNSWMRLITGILFALGVVWFIFPYLGRSFDYE